MSFSGLDSERVQRGRYSFLFAARKAHQLVRPRVGAPPSGHDGMVSQLFGRNLFSPELLGLWCIEALGSGLVAYLLLSADLADGAAGNLLRQHAASQVAQAAVLALTLGLVSFVVGMYSRDLYGETRRLLVGTALGGGIALPAIWLAGRAAGIDFDAMAGEGVLPLEALAGWALFVLTVRLAFSHAIRANLFVRRVLVVGAGPDDTAATRLVAAQRTLHRGNVRVISVLAAHEAARLTPALLKGQKVWGIIVTNEARKLLLPAQLG